MRKSFITLLIFTIAAQIGCARNTKPDTDREPMLSNLPFVYKMPVQQGNIITKDMLDQLQMGMSKAEVRFLLGTPMLTDIFHSDRWDYTYTMRRGHEPMEKKPLTLFFDEEDRLTRIQGFVPTDPGQGIPGENNPELVVKVPDWEGEPGFIGRTLDAVGLGGD
jgi:outer membrane protein assembly factor BamE